MLSWGGRVAVTGGVTYCMLLGVSAGVDYATTAPDFAVSSLVYEEQAPAGVDSVSPRFEPRG